MGKQDQAEHRLFQLVDREQLLTSAMRGRAARTRELVEDAVQEALVKLLELVRDPRSGQLSEAFGRVRSGAETAADVALFKLRAAHFIWSCRGTRTRAEVRHGRRVQAAARIRGIAHSETPSRLARRNETSRQFAALIELEPPAVRDAIYDQHYRAESLGYHAIAANYDMTPAALEKASRRRLRRFGDHNPDLQLDSRANQAAHPPPPAAEDGDNSPSEPP